MLPLLDFKIITILYHNITDLSGYNLFDNF